MNNSRNIIKGLIIAVLLLLVSMQGGILIGVSTGGTLFTWEDDFLDESRIDTTRSSNYLLNTIEGTVSMKDTYEAWYEESWTRMKEISINNEGSQTFSEYVLDMTIYYDSDMQSDFDDLRFTDDEGNETVKTWAQWGSSAHVDLTDGTKGIPLVYNYTACTNVEAALLVGLAGYTLLDTASYRELLPDPDGI